MKKGWIWTTLLAVAAVAAGFFFLRSQQAQSRQVEILRTAEVIRGDLEITVAASGNVVAHQKIDLTFTTPGTVAAVAVEVGDYVAAGAELARLNTANLERAVRQAEIALEQAQFTLAQLTDPATEEDLQIARTALSQAAQALEVARINKEVAQSQSNETMRQVTTARDRARQTYTDILGRVERNELPSAAADSANMAFLEAEGQVGIAQLNVELQLQQAQSQWLQAYNAYLQAQENLRRLEAGPDEQQIQQTALQVEQATLNLEQAQAQLNDAILVAPFSGVVAAVNIQQNSQTTGALPAITLVDDSALYVDVTVDETDIARLAVGQTVNITLDAYPGVTLEGEIRSIAPAATNIGGIVAYPVRVQLRPDNTIAVRDGMTASVIISTDRIADVVLVPNWAVRTDQASSETYTYCYCLANGTPQRVNVTIGARNETYTEIVEGLEPGLSVALITEQRSSLLEFSGPPSRGQ